MSPAKTVPTLDEVSVEHRGSISIIRLTRPKKRNAISDGVIWLQINSAAKGTGAFTDKAGVDSLIAERKLTISDFLIDETGEAGKAYGAKATPTIVVIDKSGRIAYSGGYDD